MRFRTFLAGCLGGLLSLNSCTNSPDMTDYAAYLPVPADTATLFRALSCPMA